jgi:hypothetical protein
MSVLNTKYATLLDWAKRRDPNGKTATIVELLNQTNEILEDALFTEGNLPTGHVTTVRTGLPTIYWRLLNAGVQPSKSTTTQVTEGLGIMEAWSEVDKDLADLDGNANEFRLSEVMAFIEAMNQEMVSTLFYGNASSAPEEFNGLSVRYSSLSANNGKNIVNGGSAGGQTDNSSIWLITWGGNTFHMIFPKGSNAGLTHTNKGVVTVENAGGVSGARMEAYQDKFQWKVGAVLKDWRGVARAANIDISELVGKTGAANLNDVMTKLRHRVGPKMIKNGKPVYYMNRSVFEYFDIQGRDDVKGGGMTYQEVDGQPRYSFRGIPVKICDALLENEARVT